MTTLFVLLLALTAVLFGAYFAYAFYRASDEVEVGTLFVEP